LVEYFKSVSGRDAAWAIYFLCGRRRKRVLSTQLLREWAAETAGIPKWLFEESYHHVGDLAETAALLLPNNDSTENNHCAESLADFIENHVLKLSGAEPEEQRKSIESTWDLLGPVEKLVFHKMLTGGFRIGVQQKTVQNALGDLYGIDPAVIAHRMMGSWKPTESWFNSLQEAVSAEGEPSLPYPFCLAYPIEASDRKDLGPVEDWQIEPKWDGIRAQLIRRQGLVFLWSRGEESVGESFPEIIESASGLPDGVVLDGEILVWRESGRPDDFGALQKRLGRKNVSPKIQKDLPVRFLAYDLLENEGRDLRGLPTHSRRRTLAQLLSSNHGTISLSPLISPSDWEEVEKTVEAARENGVEGVMLKQKESPYRAGRVRKTWWKWKVEPLRIDAVLVYAQSGHGRRSGLFTDYTFSVRSGEELVPVAKAYSGLSDKEIRELDRWIKSNTREKFGPVRSVPAEQVFEIAFDSIRESKRHKAGLALRFPRIARWRRDKPVGEIDTVETIRALIS